MIEVSEVLKLHTILIDNFGGAHGVRDMAALESALARPFQTFQGNDLYPSIFEKGAAMVESVLINHPRYELIINIASGTLKFDGIAEWLRKNTKNQ